MHCSELVQTQLAMLLEDAGAVSKGGAKEQIPVFLLSFIALKNTIQEPLNEEMSSSSPNKPAT